MVLHSSPSGCFCLRRRGAKKTQKHHLSYSFGPPGVPKWSQTMCFTMVLNTRLSRRMLSTRSSIVVRALGLPRLPAGNSKHDGTTASKWPGPWAGWWAPGAPPEGARRGPGAPRERSTRRWRGFLKNSVKNSVLRMCTPLECQAHFGQTGSPTERQSRRKAVFFVVALKMARGSQKSERADPHVF